MKRIITIGREFGAGGRDLGRRLARELGIAVYDRYIILRTAKASFGRRGRRPADSGRILSGCSRRSGPR